MKYVYLLRSLTCPRQRYIGATVDLKRRLRDHNSGQSSHTSKYAPWECVVALRFLDDAKADAFERYQKTGSGHAFFARHLW